MAIVSNSPKNGYLVFSLKLFLNNGQTGEQRQSLRYQARCFSDVLKINTLKINIFWTMIFKI